MLSDKLERMLQREMEHMHYLGSNLIRLSPLNTPRNQEICYWKIFGGRSSASADTKLAEVVRWIEKPNRNNSIGKCLQIYSLVMGDLDELVKSIEQVNSYRTGPELVSYLKATTISNYFKSRGKDLTNKDMGERVQGYKILLEKIKTRKKLNENEHKIRGEFTEFVKFFCELEEKYNRWRKHRDAMDDEDYRG